MHLAKGEKKGFVADVSRKEMEGKGVGNSCTFSVHSTKVCLKSKITAPLFIYTNTRAYPEK